MSQMILVSAFDRGEGCAQHNHAVHVWVKSRSEFALEILSLVEQGLIVTLRQAKAPKDNAIQTSEIEKEFAPLFEAQKADYFEDSKND
jgi:hypothetical protein